MKQLLVFSHKSLVVSCKPIVISSKFRISYTFVFRSTSYFVAFVFYSILSTSLSAQVYTITTIAGNGKQGSTGDGHAAVSATLNNPNGVAVDKAGNIYFADENNNGIRKVTAGGIISTIAGNGSAGFSGDGHAADSSVLNAPYGIVIDGSGNIYFADEQNQRIRKISVSGKISTFAGNGTAGFSGDGHAADSAALNYPKGVAIDDSGNVYIADQDNHRIRKVNTSGIISTFAGTGTGGYSGDGKSADSAALNYPAGVAVDDSGNVYIADVLNNRIRKVNTHDTISTIAGKGTQGFAGDDGVADSAKLSLPYGVVVDGLGNVYISDQGNDRIRLVNTKGVIYTIAGKGLQGYSGDGLPADSVSLYTPAGITVDDSGNVFFADAGNNRMRKLTLLAPTISQADTILSSSSETGNQWYFNGTAIAGATGKMDTIKASGTYTVKIIPGVNTLTSLPFIIKIPPTPTITLLGNMLTSSSATGNRWYFNYLETGDTSQTDTVTSTGTYFLRVTSTGITSTSSNVIVVKTVGIEYYSVDNTLTVYPNPSTGVFNVTAQAVISTIEVMNAMGQTVLMQPVNALTATIDLSRQAKGMYFYRVTGSGNLLGTGKVVVE